MYNHNINLRKVVMIFALMIGKGGLISLCSQCLHFGFVFHAGHIDVTSTVPARVSKHNYRVKHLNHFFPLQFIYFQYRLFKKKLCDFLSKSLKHCTIFQGILLYQNFSNCQNRIKTFCPKVNNLSIC